MAQLKDTNIDGALEVAGDVTLGHKMAINGITTDGDVRENIQPINQNNNCIIGYGNYTADNGNTHIYGVAVNAYTKDNNMTVDGIQIARTDTSTITSFSSGWTYYGSASGNSPTVRRYGKVVSLTGALTNTASITINTTHVKVFTIPSGYRPTQDVLVLCQGSGANEFVLQIKSNGDVMIGRYGTASFQAIDANQWFPFHACWVME